MYIYIERLSIPGIDESENEAIKQCPVCTAVVK